MKYYRTKKKPKILIIFAIIMILFFSLFIGNSVAGDEKARLRKNQSGKSGFSLTATNKALGEVFKSISKQTGYTVIFNEEWESFPISIELVNVPLDKGMERLLKSHKISYLITYRYDKKEIVIDIIDDNNAKHEQKKVTFNVHEQSERDPENIEIIPADGDYEGYGGDGGDEISAGELMENRMDEAEIDPLDLELVPPDDSGESGITLRKLIKRRNNEKEDFSDLDLVPPDDN